MAKNNKTSNFESCLFIPNTFYKWNKTIQNFNEWILVNVVLKQARYQKDRMNFPGRLINWKKVDGQ